jgi:cardiolipin synthase
MIAGWLAAASVPWLALGTILHVVVFLAVSLHCLAAKREPASTVLWIFVAWSFPGIGAACYLMFGIERLPDRGLRHIISDHLFHQARDSRENRVTDSDEQSLAYWRALRGAVRAEPTSDLGREFSRAMDRAHTDHPLLAGNSIEPLVEGTEAYSPMLQAIRAGKHHIHLQSFIICNDAIGREFLSALAAKAREGVQVRLLYDRFGSTRALFSGLFRRYGGIPNLEIVGWTLANPLRRQFQLNLRNHRKLLIVDGHTAFIGGMNLQAENVGQGHAPPQRDYQFQINGPAVLELQFTFMRDWYHMTTADPESLLRPDYFPRPETVGKAACRVLNSGPTSKRDAITDAFFMAIVDARQQVMIVTPYFVPPRDMIRALRAAAMRGVDVHLVVPRKNNHTYAGWASRAYYGDLLDAGVHIHERLGSFLHAKALVVDGELSIVGTANWDMQSLRLNYETCMAVHSEAFASRMKEIIHDEIGYSREVDALEWSCRSNWRQLLENLFLLMTPVL